jgi:hypothetical protein
MGAAGGAGTVVSKEALREAEAGTPEVAAREVEAGIREEEGIRVVAARGADVPAWAELLLPALALREPRDEDEDEDKEVPALEPLLELVPMVPADRRLLAPLDRGRVLALVDAKSSRKSASTPPNGGGLAGMSSSSSSSSCMSWSPVPDMAAPKASSSPSLS